MLPLLSNATRNNEHFTIFIRTLEVNGWIRDLHWKYFIIQAVLLATGKIFCLKEKNSLRIMLMWAHFRFTKWILITLWYKIFKCQLQVQTLQAWRQCGERGGDHQSDPGGCQVRSELSGSEQQHLGSSGDQNSPRYHP